MTDRLSNAAPVGGLGGFPNRSPLDLPNRHSTSESDAEQSRPTADAVDLHGAVQVARRLLRQRVLVHTRRQLGLGEGAHVPLFAEVLEGEPVAAFLGRLLGAQNQLAALRVTDWPAAEIRRRLDRALRDGTDEVFELLAGDTQNGDAATAVIAEVLAEYGDRLARLAGEDSFDD